MENFVKVHVMHCGDVNMDRAIPYREKSWHPMPHSGLFRSKSKRVTVPVSAYLIEHPKGHVLVDTGWHEAVRSDLRGHFGFINWLAFRATLPEGAAIHEQLAARGIHPRDLEYVVLSHLHADHVSGLPHVQEAKKIITSKLEWEAAHREFLSGYRKNMWSGIPIDPFELEPIPFGPYGMGRDLFGDGLLTLVFTPGHTRGLVSVLAKTEGGYVLLASDVGYSTRSWEEFVLPGVLVNEEQGIASLRWVQEFSKREDCIAVIAYHDPNVVPRSY
jgi:N-acyl homoserine lactone hydrolase